MKYLIVVDMQNDFIDGSLGTDEAKGIVENVKKYIEAFEGEIIFTRDTHEGNYLKTQEGKNLPVVHCVKNTYGWQIADGIMPFSNGRKIFDKPTFGCVEMAEYLKDLGNSEEIVIVGLCTDICVISNAFLLKAYMPEVKISVVSSCCAGVTPESHKRALDAMKICQINVM